MAYRWVKFYVQWKDGSGVCHAVDEAQRVVIYDPAIPTTPCYDFWTDVTGYARKYIRDSTYNIYTNPQSSGGCVVQKIFPNDLEGPLKDTCTLCNTCATQPGRC